MYCSKRGEQPNEGAVPCGGCGAAEDSGAASAEKTISCAEATGGLEEKNYGAAFENKTSVHLFLLIW